MAAGDGQPVDADDGELAAAERLDGDDGRVESFEVECAVSGRCDEPADVVAGIMGKGKGEERNCSASR